MSSHIFNPSSFSRIFGHKLFRNSLVYTISNLLKASVPFFLLPVLTRFLSPADYGIVATFEILLIFLIVFVELNASTAVSINFFKLNKNELSVYVGNASLVALGGFLLTFLLVSLTKNQWGAFLKIPSDWIPIMVVVALANYIFTLNITLWQVEENPLPYGLFQFLQTALNFGLSLYFVVFLKWQWQGRLLGIIISSIIFAGISIYFLLQRRYLKFILNREYIWDVLHVGIPMIPHMLGSWLLIAIDRIFINSMVSVAATGIYTVGYQIGTLIRFLMQSFNQAWAPFLFRQLTIEDSQTKIKIVKFTYLTGLVLIVLALLLSAAAPVLLSSFVGPEFQAAQQYVFWITLGSAANGMYYMIVNYIVFVKKTYILAWVTLGSAILNIVLNYFLIKINGAVGAAQAMFITLTINCLLVWILSARIYKMPWLNFWK